MKTDVPHPIMFLFLAVTFGFIAVTAQPIIPTVVVEEVDTNEYPQLASGTLQWDRHPQATQYRWTNWNDWTNQGAATTGTSIVGVTMILGTNRAGVRAENTLIGATSAWVFITNTAYETNLVGIPTISTRTMSWIGGTWSPWMVATQVWYPPKYYQQQWRLNVVNSNWWGLK